MKFSKIFVEFTQKRPSRERDREMKNEIYFSSKGVFKRRAFIPFSLPLKQLTIFISEFKKELKDKNGVTQALALM